MASISYEEARADLKTVMDKVAADQAPVLIRRQTGRNVVLVARTQWDEVMARISSPAAT